MDGTAALSAGFIPPVTDTNSRMVGAGGVDANGSGDLVWREAVRRERRLAHERPDGRRQRVPPRRSRTRSGNSPGEPFRYPARKRASQRLCGDRCGTRRGVHSPLGVMRLSPTARALAGLFHAQRSQTSRSVFSLKR